MGTSQFLTRLGEIVFCNLGISLKNLKRHGNIFILSYYSREAYKLVDWLYKDCDTLFLKRKYDKFLSYRERYGNTNSG